MDLRDAGSKDFLDKMDEDMDAELARLLSEGTSVADIADHFGRKNHNKN